MRIGLCGYPKVGKTSVFEVVSGLSSPARTHSASLATVPVPDERLDRLFSDFEKAKKVHTQIEYRDPHSRETSVEGATALSLNAANAASVLALVVRGFENPNTPHVFDSIDPVRDVKLFLNRMLERDITVCERRVERIDVLYGKAKSDELARERDIIRKCIGYLRDNRPLQQVQICPAERETVRSIEFSTLKSLLIVLNVDEKDAAASRLDEITTEFKAIAPEYAAVVALCAQLECELLELDDDSRRMFMDDMGMTCLAQERIIRASFEATETIRFYTIGDDEVRAWPLKVGASSVTAAGTVHSDMARGFIRADVLTYDNYLKAGSMRDAKTQKLGRLEGKDYIVADGDIIEFRFNV